MNFIEIHVTKIHSHSMFNKHEQRIRTPYFPSNNRQFVATCTPVPPSQVNGRIQHVFLFLLHHVVRILFHELQEIRHCILCPCCVTLGYFTGRGSSWKPRAKAFKRFETLWRHFLTSCENANENSFINTFRRGMCVSARRTKFSVYFLTSL